MTDHAIEMHGVHKSYDKFQLCNVSWKLPRGTIMGLIGPNGAGKSTTIRILLGLTPHDRGRVVVLGHEIPEHQIAAKHETGFLSEDMRLYEQATLDWHMRFLRSIYPSWDDGYAAVLKKRFELDVDQKIRGMSHGQRIQAGLLLSLARRPKLLVLDEPTIGLDPVARLELLGQLTDLMRDESTSILFSSHNTLDVERISDYITMMDHGRTIASEEKEDFIHRWRRLRVRTPNEDPIPVVHGFTQVERDGPFAVLTCPDYTPAINEKLNRSGVELLQIQTMSLEEIFVASLIASRAKSTPTEVEGFVSMGAGA